MDNLESVVERVKALRHIDDQFDDYDKDIDDVVIKIVVEKAYFNLLAQTRRDNFTDGLKAVDTMQLMNVVEDLANIYLNRIATEGYQSENFGDHARAFNQDIPTSILRSIYPYRIMVVR